MSTDGSGLYADIVSRFANDGVALALAGTVRSALTAKIIAETDVAKACGYTFEDIADRFSDTIEDIEKAMTFRLGKGENE